MRRLAPLVVALAASACSAFGHAPAVRTFRLSYPPPAPAYQAPAGVVRVGPFSSAQVYDRVDFIYREGPYGVGIDSYNRWIAAPSGMLADLIARDLAAARVASAVLQGASALPADHELGLRIEELDERDDGGCSAHLRVRTLLVRVGARGPRTPLFEETFASEQPCVAGEPASFAEAMSRAAEDVSGQLIARIASAAGS